MSQKKEIKLTSEGFLEVENELNKLREEDRPRIIQAIKEARAQGDLSENADYDAAREEQAKVEARIKELEYMMEHATIVESTKKGVVGLGSVVTVLDIDMDEEDEYKIVGSLEANILENKISDESPLGSALMGHKVGEVVTVLNPNGQEYEVKIVKVA